LLGQKKPALRGRLSNFHISLPSDLDAVLVQTLNRDSISFIQLLKHSLPSLGRLIVTSRDLYRLMLLHLGIRDHLLNSASDVLVRIGYEGNADRVLVHVILLGLTV
jgi:hypothetical protein